MKTMILSILCIFLYLTSSAQLDENFGDGELFSNPTWLGDVSDFQVIGGILKLNAEDGGNSTIHTPVVFPDSIVWRFDIAMDFSPSGSNKLTIILASQVAGDLTNSYYLEVGETGSNDALSLFMNYEGVQTLLGRATDGSLGTDPAYASLIVSYDKDHMWKVTADYSNQGIFEEEILVLDDSFIASDYHSFGLICDYTSTRKDKFYFQSFVIDTLSPDRKGPELIRAEAINDHQIKLDFNEALSEGSIQDLNNYQLTPDLIVDAILWNAINPKILYLITNEEIGSGIIYDLKIENLTDNFNNLMNPTLIEISLVESPSKGDLIINEVLFNPVTNGNDFIEIYNNSIKTIKLDSLILFNNQNEQFVILNTSRLLKANEYMAFTKEAFSIIDLFPKHDADFILDHKIPSMNNTDGNIGIYLYEHGNRIMIDSFDYDESFHFPYLEDNNGVSLERIDPNGKTNNKSNWHSAASNYNFGSPGLKNSVNLPEVSSATEMFQVITEVFSPDGDSFDDIMLLQYTFKNSDHIVSASVYNNRGVHIKDLIQHETLSTEGYITWDGVDQDGNLSEIGIYIINIDYISPQQVHKSVKKTCVLARQL